MKSNSNVQDPEWLRAFAEVQRQTAEAHSAYQRSMAESHMAFLRTSEAAIASISGHSAPGVYRPLEAVRLEAAVTPPRPQPVVQAPRPAPAPAPIIPMAAAPVIAKAAPAAVAAPVPAPPAAASGPSISQALLAVVADKTGYPKDMIGLDMEIEADLGIDSIKRVEILSAVQELVPSLPAIPAAELGAMRTLRNILDRFGAAADVTAPTGAPPAPAAPAPSAAAPAPHSAGGPSITSALLAVVADKTGYPKDMIGLDMEIEADLGIDSIKRVEILSAVQELVPSLPSIPAAELGAMRTLRNILDRFGAPAEVATSPATPTSPAPVPTVASPAPSAGAVTSSILDVLLSVVAEKTGYPKEMVGLDMEIEADLGIDSIKRVEILSAVQEQVPSLPSIPAAELGALRTLRQVLERLGGTDGGPGGAPPSPSGQPPGGGGEKAAPPPAGVLAAPMPASPAPAALGRFVAARRAAPRPGFSPRGLFGGEVLVVRDANGIADLLADLLNKRGVTARAVDSVDEGKGTAAHAARVIDLSALSDGQSADEAIRVQKEIFETARDVAQGALEPRLFIAVADLFGSSPFSEWTGGIPGLVRTLALEAPDLVTRFISIAKGRLDPDRLAQMLAAEILEGGADLDIAIDASSNRTSLYFEDAAPQEPRVGANGLAEDSVLIVSGGARGVTASCLEALARQGRYRFAILGRTDSDFAPAWAENRATEGELQGAFITAERAKGHTPTPAEARQAAQAVNAARETRATIKAIETLGSSVLYLPCDLKDRGDVSMAVQSVRGHFKKIDGIVHAAGVLADKRIAEKTDAQFNSVFDTKVAGLQNLLEATRTDDLKVLCFFGSVAGRVGNPGQADYAMANETLEAIAQFESRQRNDARVRVLHWGPWDGGMVTPSLRAVFLERGVALIPVSDGARLFVEAISNPEAPVSMVVGGRPDTSVLLGHGAARKVVGDLIVSSATSPHLASHAVKGVPVFPVALALEAFARIARSTRPDLRLSAIKDLRVLKGIRIENFQGQGTRLEISCEQASNGSGARLSCELRSPGGPVHYRATAEMTDRSKPHVSPHAFEAPKGGTPWTPEEVYGPVLFHGPDFQVLKGVRSVGPQGGSALVASTRDIGWIGGPYATDPAAVDAGLQMAILMGMRALGKTSLPTGVESLTIHIDEPTNGPLHCSIRSRSVTDLKTVSDAIVRTEDGRLLCELRGIEMHMVDTQTGTAA